jgi:hypothetical protein
MFHSPISGNASTTGNTQDSGASQARQQAREATSSVEFLQDRVDRLELICEALWELLKTRMDVNDDQLMGWIAELDLTDGTADGKRSRGPAECPSCSRPNSPRHQNCIYCGTMLKTTPFG